MQFEFDNQKSIANALKHGIDFVEAQVLWADDYLIEVQVAYIGESRFIVVGKIRDKHWTAVVTYRGSVVRIISVRRSRKEEVNLYEQTNRI